jgi:hypothetical protein
MDARDPQPSRPPAPREEPPEAQEPIIDEPGKEVPAVDPRRPGAPCTIREPHQSPDSEPQPAHNREEQ